MASIGPNAGSRLRRLACALLLVLAGPAHAVLTPAEREELRGALSALSRALEPAASARAGELFHRDETRVPELNAVLRAWFAERSCTTLLGQWLLSAALAPPSPDTRSRVQEALGGALVESVAATFDALLPEELSPAMVSDPVRYEDLRSRLQLLGELAWRGEDLSGASRHAHAARLGRLVARHADVLRGDVTIKVGARPKLAALRAQLHKILRDLPRPFDAEQFLANAGFVGIHAQVLRRHGIVVLDNNGFDLPQLDAIDQVLNAVPSDLHRLTHISQNDLLGNLVGDRAELEVRGSVGVNLAVTPVYADLENQFPPDVEPRRIRTFCAVLQHEINHGVDELTIQRDPARVRWRDALLARAGRHDPLQYLRSMFPASTFPDAPQELFASIANQYLADTVHTLALARARLAEGRTAPLDQFLFFADVYSRGGDTTLFFAQDEECNYSAYPVRIRRNGGGRIEGIAWPGGEARFTLDDEGWVVR